MKRVTKIAKKKNGQFQESLPIGTSSQYVTVDDNKTISLKQVLGDYTKIPNGKISEAIKALDEKQIQITDASQTENGLMSSTDFKKINPQVLSKATDDLNNIKNVGWYKIIPVNDVILVKNIPNGTYPTGISNFPSFLEVQKVNDTSLFQRLRTINGEYFERYYTSGGLWSNWDRPLAPMKGASTTITGKSGLVPTPSAGNSNRFLSSAGTWKVPIDTWQPNTSTQAGYVANPNSAANKVWKTDANGNPGWGDGMSVMTGATTAIAGKMGAVPAPAAGQNTYLLRGDGTWVEPIKNAGGGTDGKILSDTEWWVLNSLTGCTSGNRHSIELIPPENAGHGGYIDFHYNGSTEDYTARIIESPKGTIYIRDNLNLRDTATINGKLNVAGAATIQGQMNTNTIKAWKASYFNAGLYATDMGSGQSSKPVIVSSSAATGLTYSLNSYAGTSLRVSGRWGASSGSSTKSIAVSSSDIRLKKNIKENTTSGLELINKIPLYEFDWKDSGKHQRLGFVADYLEKIDPNLSIGDKTEDENGNPIYKSVDTFYLQGFEIKAIQELSQQNDELKKEINLLKEEIKELKKK